jgi:hypothetical protein
MIDPQWWCPLKRKQVAARGVSSGNDKKMLMNEELGTAKRNGTQ